MKKFLSLILSLTLILTAASGLRVRAADSVLLNENFDDGASKITADSALKTEYVDISTITGATGGNRSGKVLKISKTASSTAGGGKAYIPFPKVSGSFTLKYKALLAEGNGSVALGAVSGESSNHWFKSGMYTKFIRLNGSTYEEKK